MAVRVSPSCKVCQENEFLVSTNLYVEQTLHVTDWYARLYVLGAMLVTTACTLDLKRYVWPFLTIPSILWASLRLETTLSMLSYWRPHCSQLSLLH